MGEAAVPYHGALKYPPNLARYGGGWSTFSGGAISLSLSRRRRVSDTQSLSVRDLTPPRPRLAPQRQLGRLSADLSSTEAKGLLLSGNEREVIRRIPRWKWDTSSLCVESVALLLSKIELPWKFEVLGC